MQIYGDEHIRLTGIIQKIQEHRAHVQFPQFQKKISIPLSYIHGKIKADPSKIQELEIDTWFLKKNRILPIDYNEIFLF